MTCLGPDSSQQRVKDGETRPPVPGDPERALGNRPRWPLAAWFEDCDGVTEPLTSGGDGGRIIGVH